MNASQDAYPTIRRWLIVNPEFTGCYVDINLFQKCIDRRQLNATNNEQPNNRPHQPSKSAQRSVMLGHGKVKTHFRNRT